jgi:hypothetical protein
VDGYLRHFENPDKLTAEDTLYMPSDALKIVVGTEVKHAAPTNYENDLLIEIVTRNKGSWILCAADIDEML